MNQIFGVCLPAVLWVVLGIAADVSGVWILTLSSNGAAAPTFMVTLKQDGQKLNGTCSTDDLDDEFTVTGQVTDDAATWQCASPGLTVDFSGTPIGGSRLEMTGSWSTSAAGKGTFTAKKQRRLSQSA